MITPSYIIDEIFRIHDSPQDYTDYDILNLITDIVESAKKNTYFAKNLECVLKDKRESCGFCPECGEELVQGSTKVYHSELAEFGYEPYEESGFSYCPNCKWNYGNEN